MYGSSFYGGAGNDTLIGSARNDYFFGGSGDDIFDMSGTFMAHKMISNNDRVVDFNPGRDGNAPLADSGDKIRITGATTIGYRFVDTNNDGRFDSTILYDGTDVNGGVLGWLKGFAGPLFLSDFIGDVTVVTVIDDAMISTEWGQFGQHFITAGPEMTRCMAGLEMTGYMAMRVMTLHGGAGRDTLYGGAGNDTLNGGAGNDHLGGGFWQ